MRTIRPLADRVLVLPDSIPTKTTGLAVPKTQAEEPTEGVVVAVGFLARHASGIDKEGKLQRLGEGQGVLPGERVQFPKFGGRKTMHNGKEHRLLRLEEIEAVIEDTEG